MSVVINNNFDLPFSIRDNKWSCVIHWCSVNRCFVGYVPELGVYIKEGRLRGRISIQEKSREKVLQELERLVEMAIINEDKAKERANKRKIAAAKASATKKLNKKTANKKAANKKRKK